MDLVSFSVTNYRSITKAYKLPIRRSTVLIGPNNEGKSNILRALVITLESLRRIGGARIERGRLRQSERYLEFYDWERDFPVTLQAKSPVGESVFDVEFRLSDEEVSDFESEVQSSLNGTLPIQLSLGENSGGFKVLKKGPGGPALSKKAEQIAKFISKRINLSYIPAIRTAKSAHEIVGELVEKELAVVESDTKYLEAIKALAAIQQPVLDKISASIKETLREFLPNVREVEVSISEEERFRALRRACEIIVDDGTPTQLLRKGDGVQSLAALSLMRHASESSGAGRNLILAIEEPESHLHPNAIHQLKGVVAEIANKHQVIMTTHCPLFVDRAAIKSNILVHDNKARPAKNVRQIREILGVRAADNLQHAELILIVEGEDDRNSLRALLAAHSKAVGSALDQGTLGIESLHGGSNLCYKLSQIREAICAAHAFLDYDTCALRASEKAQQEGLLTLANVTFATCMGMKESEFEDLIDEALYAPLLINRYGVSIQNPKFRGNSKWSDRLATTFRHQGKPWSSQIEAKVKAEISELISSNAGMALNIHKRASFDALTRALELAINAIQAARA
jgi:putative ATP-dependent endonuclease of the OLD family